METIAVYKEERVKVYSITQKSSLALITLNFPTEETDQWGNWIGQLEDQIGRFELVTCQTDNKERSNLNLLLTQKNYDFYCSRVQHLLENNQQTTSRQTFPVDLLFLHGPHFQDRFGIADVAVNALRQSKIDILVTGCAGTSMYVVTPANQGQKSLKVLNDTFLIPT